MSTSIVQNSNVNERELLGALRALRKGDFTVRLPNDWSGTAGKIADTLNGFGYSASADLGADSMKEIRRFLSEWSESRAGAEDETTASFR